MNNLSITDLAQRWFRSGPDSHSPDPARNSLFEMLYKAHCRRHGVEMPYSELSYQDGDHHDACAMLYRWYEQRYKIELKMPTGSQGQKRGVNPNSDDYTFDLLYSDDRQFRNYLLSPLPQSGSQDLLAFVLHTAVAFLVPLEELDPVLQHLGFHPLHVKNIHHLAIAYVLLTADPGTASGDFNPFAAVKRLYLTACRILEEPAVPQDNSYSFAGLETRIIRDALLLNKGLAAQNFEALVVRNRAALNMRHSMILRDFHKLSTVFIHIFDSKAAPEDFEFPEEAYSFYRFVVRFCHERVHKKTDKTKTDLTRKKFREQLTGKIDLEQKHPTRNVLILLWLYTYCFAFLPGVIIDKTAFNRIVRQLQRFDPAWGDQAKACYRDDLFDVYGFLTNDPDRGAARIFRGSDFFAFINEKLQLRYGWGPLNDRLPFDHYIHDLKDLTLWIESDGSCGRAFCGHHPLAGLEEPVDNVPFPLVVITQIFGILAQLHAGKAAQYKYARLSPRPLKCSLYEQL